jgi:hypothetical protein
MTHSEALEVLKILAVSALRSGIIQDFDTAEKIKLAVEKLQDLINSN